MEYRQLGRSDLAVSEICLGTMTFGTQNTEAEAHTQLDYALAQGINFIDTAEMYSVPPCAESYGKTETYIGNWLRRQARDRIVLATKIAGPGRGMAWIRNGELGFGRKNLRDALEASLKRLQTDYVDLYQLHWPDRNAPTFGAYRFDPAKERPATPLLETLETLAELVQAGKIRCVGLSNETPWGVMEFLRLAAAHGLPRIVSVQNAYSLLNRTFETGLAEISFREDVPLLPYSALAFGHLTGKYLDDPQAPGRVNQFAGFGQRYAKAGVRPATEAYCSLARRHGLTPTQLALAFVRSRWFVASTILGATTLTQLRENIAAWDITLPEEIPDGIEAIHLRHTNPAP
ncbi:MAG: NADP(H)-dependent aldo-keto reductase [Rhodocyclales bacterium GWA2_65_20]|nr:MAG: NADP(H)-dependent aldo-keto reductase [Rhodocyclales bacterium GWA2_65_20]